MQPRTAKHRVALRGAASRLWNLCWHTRPARHGQARAVDRWPVRKPPMLASCAPSTSEAPPPATHTNGDPVNICLSAAAPTQACTRKRPPMPVDLRAHAAALRMQCVRVLHGLRRLGGPAGREGYGDDKLWPYIHACRRLGCYFARHGEVTNPAASTTLVFACQLASVTLPETAHTRAQPLIARLRCFSTPLAARPPH